MLTDIIAVIMQGTDVVVCFIELTVKNRRKILHLLISVVATF